MLDPRTALILIALLGLTNGWVLSFVRRDLPRDLRRAAWTWQQGTLLQAGGYFAYAIQDRLPAGWAVSIANTLLLTGLSGYWLAIHRFNHRPASWHLLWAAALGSLASAWLALVWPHYGYRVVAVSLAIGVILIGCAWTQSRHRRIPPPRSGYLLVALLTLTAVFMLIRAIYALLRLGASGTLLAANNLETVTVILFAMLPLVATTAFVLMCAERIRRQLERAVSEDFTTGALSRRSISEAVARLATQLREQPGRFSLAMLDVDHFKAINDRFGHATGDHVLKTIVETMKTVCREGDLIGRMGGEEFLVVLLDTDEHTALVAAERIRTAVEALHIHRGSDLVKVTISIGVSTFGIGGDDFERMLARADNALYAAKAAGRNCVHVG